MYSFETKIRVRYGETDQMGYVYYGVYAQYFEVGRVELLRSLGISYKKLEQAGCMLPVINFEISYKKPALYDDELNIRTTIKLLPTTKITFEYETYNAENILLYSGKVVLVFVDKSTMKPTLPPKIILEKLEVRF